MISFVQISLAILLCCVCSRGQPDEQRVIVVYDVAGDNDTLSLNVTAVQPSVYVEGTTLVSNITQNGIRIDIFAITHCTNVDRLVEWEAVCKQFETDPSVLSCELDEEVSLNAVPSLGTASPNDPLYPRQWGLSAIDIPGMWSKGVFGHPSVRVCVVDSEYRSNELMYLMVHDMSYPGGVQRKETILWLLERAEVSEAVIREIMEEIE